MLHYSIYIAYTSAYCKIGYTGNSPADRVKAFQTGCPLPITKIIWWTGFTKVEALNLERAIHQHLAHWHSDGEWFRYNKGIFRQVIYCIPKDLKTYRKTLRPKGVADMSVQVSITIKRLLADHDLTQLSKLQVDMLHNSQNYPAERFHLYTKEVILDLLDVGIAHILNRMCKNQGMTDTDVTAGIITELKPRGLTVYDFKDAELFKMKYNYLLRLVA